MTGLAFLFKSREARKLVGMKSSFVGRPLVDCASSFLGLAEAVEPRRIGW